MPSGVVVCTVAQTFRPSKWPRLSVPAAGSELTGRQSISAGHAGGPLPQPAAGPALPSLGMLEATAS